MERRDFLKYIGAAVAGTAVTSCGADKAVEIAEKAAATKSGTGTMTYRTNKHGDKVSLLGYGCMRLPTKKGTSAREDKSAEIDQEEFNAHIDYAIEHGVNLFDTSPAYCQGRSETHTGIALSRHPREKYYISTKLSNFSAETWSREASIKMYENSHKNLKVDVIDYMLLHGIGMPAKDLRGNSLSGMEAFEKRYIENGILDFLTEEREKGRIRNLGFSYHGDIAVFDRLLSMNDKYHWDFALIQMNYVDWKHAKEVNERNTNAEYLYGELEKRGIPALVMEPLLGGRLASTLNFMAAKMKQLRPDDSIASWSMRYIGSFPNVLSVLSGMTYRENLIENVATYSPLDPCTEKEFELLEEVAQAILKYHTVPCTRCQYCMPCPYGIDIPKIFTHYNTCVNEGNVTTNAESPEFAKARRAFLLGYDRSVPKLRQAAHCVGCGACKFHCPQGIDIPAELLSIDKYVEELKQSL